MASLDAAPATRGVGAERMIDQHRVPVPLAPASRARCCASARCTLGAPAARAAARVSEASIGRGATISTARAGEVGRRERGAPAPSARRQRNDDAEGRAFARRAFDRRCGRPCARRCGARSRARGRCRRTCGSMPPSACSNSWKMRACCSGAMPMPVSRTSNTISSGCAPGSTTTLTPPVSVNLMALPARLSSTWRSRVASPITRSGSRSSTSEAISRPLACARGASSSTTSSTSVASANGCGVELELAGLDLGEVENVLDQRQQRVAGRLGGLDVGRSAPASAACRAADRPCRGCR